MRTLSVSKLKAHLSEALRAVQSGDEIIVEDRGRPIARLVAVHQEGADADERARLVAAGVLRPGRGLDEAFLQRPRGADPGASVRHALAAEREEGW